MNHRSVAQTPGIDVAKGRVTIGNASRDPQDSDPGGLIFDKIARDAVCLITLPSNPIANLSQDQVQAIFTGQVRSWEDVPGAKSTGAISLISRTAASGTGDAFRSIFLGPSRSVAASSSAKSSNGLVNQCGRSDRDAIGFVSLDFLAGVSAVGYKGVPCTLRNAKPGQYGGTRNFWMVTRTALGMGRIIGDTAIVVILAGGTSSSRRPGASRASGRSRGRARPSRRTSSRTRRRARATRPPRSTQRPLSCS